MARPTGRRTMRAVLAVAVLTGLAGLAGCGQFTDEGLHVDPAKAAAAGTPTSSTGASPAPSGDAASDLPALASSTPPSGPAVDLLWKLVDRARAGSANGCVTASKLYPLLRKRSPKQIAAVNRAISRELAWSYRADVWGAAFLINAWASDDGFEYFRGWMITQGRRTFERAVLDPDTLAANPEVRARAARKAGTKSDVLACEQLLISASEAYLNRTERDVPDPKVRYPDPGELWDFTNADESARRLPLLTDLMLK